MRNTLHQHLSSPKNRNFLVGCIAFILFVIVLGSVFVSKIITDPGVVFLFSEQGAEWIRFRERTILKIRWSQTLVTVFRTRFEVNRLPKNAVLNFRAMKLAEIRLDDQVLYKETSFPVHEWKKVRRINLTSKLTSGVHELRIAVQNQNGHPALIAYSKPLVLFTGKHWEASIDGQTWQKALPVNDTPPLPLSRSFQRADQAFISNIHIYAPIFMMVFLGSLLFMHPRQPHWSVHLRPTAKKMRWMLLALWMIIAVNNIGKIPLDIGMDIKWHMQYVMYIVDNMRIPLAIEGWQMFQPPLFYIISAIIYKVFLHFFSPDVLERIIRIIPLLCGAAQVELSYRVAVCISGQR